MAENAYIDRARQCALKLLKPAKKDIERGLELHKNSVVIDTYGFGLVGGGDPAKLRAAIEAGASQLEMQDMIEDMGMTGYLDNETLLREFKEIWNASGVTCTFRNSGEEGQHPMRLIKRLSHFVYVTDRLRHFTPKAINAKDIALAKSENRHCYCLTCNGVPLPQTWVSVEEELGYISIFFQLGCRMMHLTYNRRNMLGDGCAEAANGGLSDFGKAAIAEMNRLGVIVDVAHSGWQTSLEAAQVSKKPIVASHTTCAAIQMHVRSKPDEIIRTIADHGGLIGICAIPAFLGKTGDINALLDHVDYAAKKFGADHVAIGTDVGDRLTIHEVSAVPKAQKKRQRFESLWPPDDPIFSPEWQKEEQKLSLAWVNWPYFTVGLVQRGYSDADIQKIIGGNMLRVFKAVLPDSEKKECA